MKELDIAHFLKTKLEENRLMEVVKTESLYSNIENNYLKQLFAIMHQRFNVLFEFMKSKKKAMDILMHQRVGNC